MKYTFGWLLLLGIVLGIAQLGKMTSEQFKPSAPLAARATSTEDDIVVPTSPATPSATQSGIFYIPVVRVVDGDTIDVTLDGERVRVRLIGVDTPETVDPRRPVQCFGSEAAERTRLLLSGGEVRLELDPSQGEKDKYGRLLAYVFTPDGTFVNRELIRGGYAHEYTYRLPYRYQREFKDAEIYARASELGLWAPDACKGEF